MIALFTAFMLPIFISIIFIPYWTRKTESFGVTIPESAYPDRDIRRLRKGYAWIMSSISILLIIGLFIARPLVNNDTDSLTVLFTTLITAFLVISFITYLFFHFKMKRLKEVKEWAKGKSELLVIDTTFYNNKLTYSNAWFIISFAIIISTFIFTLIKYDNLPAQIPMQYDFSGNVTNWVDKSYRSAFMMPVMQIHMILLFIFINTMIGKAKQQVSAVNSEESAMKNVIFRKRWSAFMVIIGTMTVLLFSYVQFSIIFSIKPIYSSVIIITYTFIVIMAAIILSITTGQGGSRIASKSTVAGEVIDRDDDQYWKLGQFYFNKNDPTIFLEKRFGVGWTANLARPTTWLILIIIIGSAIAIPLLLT